jgi:hypothetical protein
MNDNIVPVQSAERPLCIIKCGLDRIQSSDDRLRRDALRVFASLYDPSNLLEPIAEQSVTNQTISVSSIAEVDFPSCPCTDEGRAASVNILGGLFSTIQTLAAKHFGYRRCAQVLHFFGEDEVVGDDWNELLRSLEPLPTHARTDLLGWLGLNWKASGVDGQAARSVLDAIDSVSFSLDPESQAA